MSVNEDRGQDCWDYISGEQTEHIRKTEDFLIDERQSII
jgi:hypothetical protein